MRKIYFVTLFLLITVSFQLTYLYSDNHQQGTVAGITNKEHEIENSVSIGEYRFTLFGYTSPLAQVTFEGMGIFDQTIADNQGYFQFDNRFSPYSSREACLSSKDQFGRLSSPVCLPPFPVNYNVNIGPVVMPPTLSLDKTDYFMGDQVILSGQAVPNTEVRLSIFGDNKNKLKAQNTKFETNSNLKIRILQIISDFGFRISNFALIKPVEAFGFPQLNIMSDSKGNFSINLPSSSPEKFRLFAQTDFKKTLSPNSIKLNLSILPVWMIVMKFFLLLFSLIRPRLLEILIITEITYIIYVIKGHIYNKAIVPYQNHLPTIEERHLPTNIEKALYL